MIGAGALGDRQLLGAAGGGNDAGAHRLGDLHRGQADAARGAQHQHALARA